MAILVFEPKSCKKNIKASNKITNQMVPCKSNLDLELCLGSCKQKITSKKALRPNIFALFCRAYKSAIMVMATG